MKHPIALPAAALMLIFALAACVAAPATIAQSAAADQGRSAPARVTPAAVRDGVGLGRPVVITNDRGGNVLATIGRRNDLAASGRPVEIRGYCRSACTLFLSLPNACLGPGAEVGFHAPRLPGTTTIPALVPEIMAQYYRGEVRRRWVTDWSRRTEMTRMSAAEYRRLDPQMRVCGPAR